MDESMTAESKKQDAQEPPLSVRRIAGEILAGTAVGLAAGFPVAFEIRAWAHRGCFNGLVAWVLLLLVFPPLHGLASAVGVYLVGRVGRQTGSFLPTLGCAFLGACVALAAMSPAFAISPASLMGVGKIVLWAFVLFSAPVLATFGFNSTRRWRSPSQTGFRGTTLALLLLAVSPTLVIGVREYPRFRVRWQVTRMDSGTATLRELIKGLKSSDWKIRESAAGGLAKLGPKAKPAVPALTEALKYRDTVDCASHALAAIGPDAEPAIPALVEAIRRVPRILAESDYRYDSFQKNAAQALAGIGPASLPALNELLKDEQVFARRCAAGALAEMGPEAKPAAPALTDALRDEDEVVRQRARAALERIDPNWSQTAGPE